MATATTIATLLAFAISWAVVLTRLPAAIRDRHQRLPVAGVLAFTALSTINQPWARRALDGLSPHLSDHLIVSAAISFTTVLLALVARAYQNTSRLIYLPGALILAILTVIYVAYGPSAQEPFAPQPAMSQPMVLYLLIDLGYVALVCLICSVLFWIHLPKTRGMGWIRPGMTLLALGVTASVLSGILVSFRLVFGNGTLHLVQVMLANMALVMLVLGLSVMSLVPVQRALTHWWEVQRLYPLWYRLCQSAPHVTLDRPRHRLYELVRAGDVTWRLRRQIVEIRDALNWLRGYVSQDVLHAAGDYAGQIARPHERQAVATACWVAVALEAQRAGIPRDHTPAPLPADQLPISRDASDLDFEVPWMRELSRARRLPGVARFPELSATPSTT
ncbi:hypothetical protein D5S17_19665 [Pseudonocardiaceae bacterium YIM PH 21723]|nr:hypothetical protein D5S17_19665 [Pseudonocardiaceae bacterium YIM PH 21723]